jgi:lysophospholipase L1-like esterase
MKNPSLMQDRRIYKTGLISAAGGAVLSLSMVLLRKGVLTLSINLMLFVTNLVLFLALERSCRPPRNNPARFRKETEKAHEKHPPVLFCLGDSLTQGACSANFPDEVHRRICQACNVPPTTSQSAPFSPSCPLWVINAGQNGIDTWTTLQERVDWVLVCNPDYVLIMIGSNDVRCFYKPLWSWHEQLVWKLPEAPTLEGLKRHIQEMVRRILDSSSSLEVGLCTLPPMGEDLVHPANVWIKRSNIVIEKIATSNKSRCTLIPIHEAMEKAIRAETTTTRKKPSVDHFVERGIIMAVARLLFGLSWNAVSKPSGNVVLAGDSIHLNERGRDIVSDLVVSWLNKKNALKYE